MGGGGGGERWGGGVGVSVLGAGGGGGVGGGGWGGEWKGKYSGPGWLLVKALYGHPDAGTFWQKHCETRLKNVGFTPVPEWPSVFMHRRLK